MSAQTKAVKDPRLTRQIAADVADSCPEQHQLQTWCQAAAAHVTELSQTAQPGLTVRYVSLAESQTLNRDFRDRDKPTNVLSFPGVFATLPPELLAELEAHERDYLGDLAICPAVVAAEARQQGKTLQAHHCHMFIHGLLHLMGFDHQTTAEAERMEVLETAILAALDYPNPYLSS